MTRSRPVLLAGLAAAALLLLTALAAVAARGGSYAPALPSPSAPSVSLPPVAADVPETTAAGAPGTGPPPPAGAGALAVVQFWLIVVLVLAGVVVLVWSLLLNRPRRWSSRSARAAELTTPTGAGSTAIPAAVERALTAVEQPDAREAVVQAWLVLGVAAAGAGTPAQPAETATEYADRLAAVHRLPPVAVHRLAALYREARFSDHPVSGAQRDEARAALTALRTALAVPR